MPFFMSSPYDAAQAMSDCLIRRALVAAVAAIVSWSSVVHISWMPVAWRCCVCAAAVALPFFSSAPTALSCFFDFFWAVLSAFCATSTAFSWFRMSSNA